MDRRMNDLRESDACSSAVPPPMFQMNNYVTSIKTIENRYPKVSVVTEVWSLNFLNSLFYTGTKNWKNRSSNLFAQAARLERTSGTFSYNSKVGRSFPFVLQEAISWHIF